MDGSKYANPNIINPIKPNGGGIKKATTIPIPAKIMPSLVQSGHPPVEQDWPFFIDDCFSILENIDQYL